MQPLRIIYDATTTNSLLSNPLRNFIYLYPQPRGMAVLTATDRAAVLTLPASSSGDRNRASSSGERNQTLDSADRVAAPTPAHNTVQPLRK